MDAEDIAALRASVALLRESADTIVATANRATSRVDRTTLADLRAAARHIDDLLAHGQPVLGDTFVIPTDS